MNRNDPAQYKVAAIQFEPELFAKSTNIERLVVLTEEAARNGAKLIVHPEMATTGYCWASRAEIAPYVEPIPGPTTGRFGQIASEYDCYIVVAMAEIAPETGIFYNSAALIGPGGVVGVYRKVHSYISEPKWAKDGDLGFPVFDTAIGRIAITICMDAVFPESVRIPALLGADIICFPTNWLVEKCPASAWIARAVDNGVYFLAANRYGLERGIQFSGGSCLINPDGSIQSVLDRGDGIVYGLVDLSGNQRSDSRGTVDRLAGRRPECYGALALSPYRWQDRDFHGLYGIDPLPEGKRSRIVSVQFNPAAGDIECNLREMESTVRAHGAVDLIVFPELSAVGPISTAIEAHTMAAAADHIVNRLHRVAAETGTFVIAGLVEAEGDSLFNVAVLVGRDGVAGTFRKVHLSANDRPWATAGDHFPTFNIPAGRVGMLIGDDALFPEATTSLALAGADIIACPSLMTGPAIRALGPTTVPLKRPAEMGHMPVFFHLWRERARETNTTIVFANGAAPAMGYSGIFGAAVEDDPSLQSVLDHDRTGAVTFDLDTTNLDTRFKTNPVRAKEILAMRVPNWYDDLVKPNCVPVKAEAAKLAR